MRELPSRCLIEGRILKQCLCSLNRERLGPHVLSDTSFSQKQQLLYQNGDKVLSLQPLKGQIDPTKSDYTVGKVKVEIRLAKMVLGRWGGLVGEAPDRMSFRL